MDITILEITIYIGLIIGLIMIICGIIGKKENTLGLGIIMFIIDNIVACFGFPNLDYPNGNYGVLNFGSKSTIILFLIWIPIIISDIKKAKENGLKAEKLKIVPSRSKEELQAKEFFVKIKKEKYDIKNDEVLDILSSTYKISKEEIIRKYKKGRDIFFKDKRALEKENKLKQEEEEKEKKLKILDEEKEKNNTEKEKTLLKEKDKYLTFLQKRQKELDLSASKYKSAASSFVKSAYGSNIPKQKDKYIMSGIANGIAGPAAAIMTANDIDRQNAEARARAKEMEPYTQLAAKACMNQAIEKQIKAESALNDVNKFIKAVEEALIDNNIQKISNLIHFEIKKVKLTELNTFRVRFKSQIDDVKILNKNAIIDGSYAVNIYDSNNNIVATGYYNGGNFHTDSSDVTVSKYNVGFKDEEEGSIICITNDNFKEDNESEYHCLFEPINLWIIEKKW